MPLLHWRSLTALLMHHQWIPLRIYLFQLVLLSNHIDELDEGPRAYMFHLLWMVRVRISFQHTLHTSHTSYRLFRLWNRCHSRLSKVVRGHVKVFLKGLEEESCKIRPDLTNRKPRISDRPRDGHIAAILLVWWRLGSILLKLNSWFVASWQHLKIKWVI